jgi:hypothetical protein
VTMVMRIEEFWEPGAARVALHIALALAVLVLLAIKISIPRFFPRLSGHLFFLGVTVYTLSFTLVAITAGYYLVWKMNQKPYISHFAIENNIMDQDLGKQLFIDKCSTCHVLERIMQPRSPKDWERVINNMVALAAPRIKVDEATQILNYLVHNQVPKPATETDGGIVARTCLRCHQPTEIFAANRTAEEWRMIVLQMNKIDPQVVPADQTDQIVQALMSAGPRP